MTCKLCGFRIRTETEQFEEIGQIEFAHVRCVDEKEAAESKEDRLDNQ